MTKDDAMTFDQAATVVMRNEGGYVDDKNDPGGETKYGISKRAYPHLDILSLSCDDAKSIYFNDYWVRGRIGEMPVGLRLIMLDMAVLHGVRGAIVILQQAINGSGFNLKVDGIIGDKTLAAATYCEPDRLRAYRVLRLSRIVVGRPTMEKYWYGWFRRAISV